MAEEKGVWRTIRGRRVFIREGESLADAMIKSGKFKDLKRSEYQSTKNEMSRGINAKRAFEGETSSKGVRKAINRLRTTDRTSVYGTGKQDIKNRINENANIEGGANTRVKRNWNRYSEEQRREEREKILRQKIQDYKNKKGDPNKADVSFKTFMKQLETGENEGKNYVEWKASQREKARNTGMTKQEEEYELYKRAKINPDSIDPMTENSTDWEALDKKFAGRYNQEIVDRVKNNKIVDSFGNNVVYQDKNGNWINSRENYNNYVNGKSDRLGGELVLNEKEARQRLAELDADEKYPYQGYVADMKSGNSEKAKKLTQENLDKMYKTIGYDDSKYNYGFNKDADIEFTNRIINEVKTSKIDKISSKADMEIKKETQRIDKRPTVADVRKTLRNMNSWSDEYQYGNIVVTKIGNTGYHIRNVDDVADPMTDYFPGVYGVKEKQVLKTLEEKGFITNNKDVKAKVERFKERKGKIDYTKPTTLKLKQLYETSFGDDKKEISAELNVRGYYRKGNRWTRK